MARQAISIGAVANDGTGDNLRTGGGKINDNFIELYDRVAALELAAAAGNTVDATQTSQITALQGIDTATAAQITALQGADTSFAAQLAAETAARQASDLQPFIPTTNGMTLAAATNYTLGAGHTVIFPALASNQWVRLSPENGDWYSLVATLDIPAGWAFSPSVFGGSEPNAAILFIYDATSQLIRVRQ